MNNQALQERHKAFLGVGWNFPPQLEPDGTLSLVVFDEDIRQAIRIILGTSPGERVMQPDFGAGLDDFVFEPINTTTFERVRTRVQEALIDWEPRIDVLDVIVTFNNQERGALLIDLHYRVRATNTVQNFVYPFYLEEGEAP
jgi:phage baseplate assembly protein W